jgi:triacylglycerol lipase
MSLEQRTLPPPQLEMALSPAKFPYPHFLNATLAPFEPNAMRFSRANAWWLAEASLLAYWQAAAIKAALSNVTGSGSAEFRAAKNIECYVAPFATFSIVAFRGTESSSLLDVLTDVKFVKDEWQPGGEVHRGFKEGLDAVWPKLAGTIPADRPAWFTGHSLGAALATLAADRFKCTEQDASYGGVYTFGSPLVGDRTFVDGFNSRHVGRSFRVVNDQDGVTLVPPPLFRYRHVNEEHFVGLSVRDAVGMDAIIDHTPCRYAILCWNAMVDETAS